MAYSALYQKYRSQDFGEVVGQEYVVRSIQNAIKNDKVGHAYLFCGPRGTGKTTMARLLAKAIVCENHENAPCGECASCKATQEGNHPDIIEINAANETHVENIRDLIERARLAPMMSNKKVYIIDEVHQLSSSAASALLKTLEEPPEYAVIILLVANADLMLPTLLSRSIKLPLAPLPDQVIEEKLIKDYYIQKYRTSSIVKFARGNLGRAIEMSENDDFIEDKNTASDIMKKVVKTESYQWKDWIDELSKDKVRLPFFLGLFMDWYRDILMAKSGAGRERLMFADEESVITEEAGEYDYEGLKYCIEAIEDAQAKVRANVKLSLVLENLFNTLSLNYGD